MPSKSPRIPARAREAFITHLSESCNVTASAKKAGMTSSAAYALRRSDAAFRDAWQQALCEGYVRIETMALEEGLKKPSGNTKESTLKARAYKLRFWSMLMSHHRASVRGGGKVAASKKPTEADITASLKAGIERIRRNRKNGDG